ncbi:MAG: DUF4921 family protein [DPANN group archaeon]|nr:DUF4921 family protein [DPANN group archaeon]
MELRKDYLLDRWVIISEGRSLRPREFTHAVQEHPAQVDYFAPGNEHLTPPELYRFPENGSAWKIRVFNNKFPAVTKDADSEFVTHNDYYTFTGAYGDHEIIVDSPDIDRQLWDLTEEELLAVLQVYRRRIGRAYEDSRIRYVNLFKNHGPEAGTSLVHSHSQLASMHLMPPLIEQKIKASLLEGGSRYLDVMEREKDSDRRCFENDHFLAICPYASRFNYELLILPKWYCPSLAIMDSSQEASLAAMLHQVLSRLKQLQVSYNFTFFNARTEDGLQFHIEVIPRMAKWAGFEFGSGIIINSVNPEDAAKFYRGELSLKR